MSSACLLLDFKVVAVIDPVGVSYSASVTRVSITGPPDQASSIKEEATGSGVADPDVQRGRTETTERGQGEVDVEGDAKDWRREAVEGAVGDVHGEAGKERE
ncbi:hypothetical protein NDU88_005795 [Pleurodeles waltl]|uniref:Uncharacterized protein n=1 Tax=Pleurodeles waltl TaxID=8319 RepID=A0AAV7TC45_PLEWA|nr:hypothetical protein NDU88_005795 [Pleurodeles waltl]